MYHTHSILLRNQLAVLTKTQNGPTRAHSGEELLSVFHFSLHVTKGESDLLFIEEEIKLQQCEFKDFLLLFINWPPSKFSFHILFFDFDLQQI